MPAQLTAFSTRLATVAAATVLALAVPDLAAAAPSDSQIAAAARAKDEAAQQVGAISARMAQADVEVHDAHAQANIALDTFQIKQAAFEEAQAAATAARAQAQAAQVALDGSRAQVAAFARTSYVQGSTSPGLQAVLSADGPAQMLERAALLDAVSQHRTDVLAAMAAAQQQAAAAEVAAHDAAVQAENLQRQAADALADAEALEVQARTQAAAVQTEKANLEAQLQQAEQTLLGLQGARAAADRRAAQQRAQQQPAPAPAPPPSAPRPPVSEPNTPAPGPDRSTTQTAIDAAMRWVGTSYAWGGGSLTGPSEGWGIDAGIVGFDCSGLTRYAYHQAGVSIPRNSRAQYGAGPQVSRANLQPGDLVFWATDPSDPETIHHVALYLGNNQMIEAPESGKTVRVTSMRFGYEYIGAVRPTA